MTQARVILTVRVVSVNFYDNIVKLKVTLEMKMIGNQGSGGFLPGEHRSRQLNEVLPLRSIKPD